MVTQKRGRMRVGAAALATAALALLVSGLVGLPGFADDGLGSLQITQTVEPQTIFVRGSGVEDAETATVRLRLKAPDVPDRLPVDVMLVVDRSASFPIEQAQQAGRRMIEALGPNDRVGLVSFAGDASLDAPLTDASRPAPVTEALASLRPEGRTSVGTGLALAGDELNDNARDDAARIVVLLTDGRNNSGRDPMAAAETAAANGVTLYTVGIGDFPNRNLLTQLTEPSGGAFFETFSDGVARTILNETIPEDTPFARNLAVELTLAPEFAFEEAERRKPTSVTERSDGATELRWERSALEANSRFAIRFRVSSETDGTWDLYDAPATVRYTNVRGREIEHDLPTPTLRVRPQPPSVEADFDVEPSSPTRFDTVQFRDRSRVEADGRITARHWTFGDGTTATGRNPTHQYGRDGTYQVTLRVRTQAGVVDRATRTIQVETPPQRVEAAFTFSPEEPTRFDTVMFQGRSTVEPRGEITSRRWNFGDGTTATGRSPTHQYDQDGTYRVTLTVTTDEGNEATARQEITVETPPQTVEADFSVSPQAPSTNDEIQFTDETTVRPRGQVVEWRWRFGDGTTSAKANPTHSYERDDTYRVTLQVTTDEGNEDSVSKTIRVETPDVRVRRTIDTFLPTHETLAGRTVRVTVDIRVNVTVNGLGLQENVPEGWTVTSVEKAGAKRRSNGNRQQWLFTRTLTAGTSRQIVYELEVPTTAQTGSFKIDGQASSASPDLSLAVQGETSFEVVTGLSIPVVVAHWNTNEGALDLEAFPEHTINQNQILQAVAWWQNGEPVPMTEDANGNLQTISFGDIQTLVAHWLTGTSVFSELPQTTDDEDKSEDDDNGDGSD